MTEPPVRRYPLFSLSDARIRFMARIRIAYSIKRQSGRSVADREKRRERRDEAPVHPKGLGRRAARVREREEFKSNFDVGKSGQCREGTDGSLRSFDRELKARSRQFSDATSIVTMGGDGLLSFSLFFPFFLSLPVESLARTTGISLPS